MSRIIHLIGNGDQAVLYKKAKGIKLTCNLPPFPVEGAYATTIVDFKMCKAITDGEITVPGDWVLGFRPKVWYDKNLNNFKMRFGSQIREFYTELPKYVANYTDFNCGHMAAHYACNRLKADIIHMYGFDSLFGTNLRSCTDFYLSSDRGHANTYRLANNWRPVWSGIFDEFKNVTFVLHHIHDLLQIPRGKNVDIAVHK